MKTAEAIMIGENILAEETEEHIVLKIKKKNRGGLSSTGKTIRVGSTGGAREFGGVTININAYVKAPKG